MNPQRKGPGPNRPPNKGAGPGRDCGRDCGRPAKSAFGLLRADSWAPAGAQESTLNKSAFGLQGRTRTRGGRARAKAKAGASGGSGGGVPWPRSVIPDFTLPDTLEKNFVRDLASNFSK